MKLRQDLLDECSKPDIEVIQLTEESIPSSHVYMEAQIFTLDSKSLIIHRSAHAHGSDKGDPQHRYLLCDIENDCELRPITEETGATAPSISPKGDYFYYFVNETEPGSGRLTLKRANLDGTDRQEITCIDGPAAGMKYGPSNIYPLSTISSDGKRLAQAAYFGDGNAAIHPYGLMCFDLDTGAVEIVIAGTSWFNMHPQYCRSLDSADSHDILIQENHGSTFDKTGQFNLIASGPGADIHVIRDDGTAFRTLAWGRDNNEFCQGHQCWRGRSRWAITSTSTKEPSEQQLIEALPCEDEGHIGIRSSGGVRNDLSRAFDHPQFFHFGSDIDGNRLVSDCGPMSEGGRLFVFDLGTPGRDPFSTAEYLLNVRCTCVKEHHIHPFLSPDGTMAFFNSDESGQLQAYMIRGV